MRMVKLDSSSSIDPKRHFLIGLTPECLEKQPLALPVFEIVNGRHGRVIDCQSPEGRRILLEGRNVLYVGASNIYGMTIRNATIRDVFEGLLASDMSDTLKECIRTHLRDLDDGGPGRFTDAAA